MQITLFYIPVSSQSEATSLGREAIVNKLAACVNVFPIQSIFPWDGSIQNEAEYVLVLKTIPSLKDKLRDYIAGRHPYDVPGIISWEVEVNDAYGAWMRENVEAL